MGADAVGDRRETGTIVDWGGRLDREAVAAAAVVERHAGLVRSVHRPPSIVRRRTPRSAKFGSLSRRAISSRPTLRKPSSSAWRLLMPSRWNFSIVTKRTPWTACAAAYNSLR